MTITLDKLANGTPGRNHDIYKAQATSEGAGTWHSLWKVAGYPGAGANPPVYTAGSGYIPTRATTGALGQANATSGNHKHLSAFSITGTTAGTLIIYDRLWACSGFTTNAVTTLSVTTPGNLTAGRDPENGFEVEPWLEVYTAPGATGATWTLTGVDSTGTSGRTWTYTHPANAETAGQMMPMIPGTAVGGCRQVTSLGFSVASGTAGDVGITLMRRLGSVPMSQINVETVKDFAGTGLPRVYDDMCIAMMVQCTTTNTGVILGQISIPEITP